jgi:hypothetical protein
VAVSCCTSLSLSSPPYGVVVLSALCCASVPLLASRAAWVYLFCCGAGEAASRPRPVLRSRYGGHCTLPPPASFSFSDVPSLLFCALHFLSAPEEEGDGRRGSHRTQKSISSPAPQILVRVSIFVACNLNKVFFSRNYPPRQVYWKQIYITQNY